MAKFYQGNEVNEGKCLLFLLGMVGILSNAGFSGFMNPTPSNILISSHLSIRNLSPFFIVASLNT